MTQPFYVTDASVYDIKPKEVIQPQNVNELLSSVKQALADNKAITMRAGGTSLAGQAIGFDTIIDVSKYLNHIELVDTTLKQVVVEPGVILDDLNQAICESGLFFAPDNSTSNRAMIGGMIGNNSCGSYSVFYGTTREHVKALDVILSDGSEATFEPLSSEQLRVKLSLNNFEGHLYQEVIELLKKHGKEIVAQFPDPSIKRRNTAYALDILYSQYQPFNPQGLPFNLAPLMSGSEGTLAVIKKATLNLMPIPKVKGLMCAHFNSVQTALEKIPNILGFNIVAMELIDKATLDCTKNNLAQKQNRFWIEQDPEAVLVIELFDESQSLVNDRLAKLQAWLLANEAYASPIIKQSHASRIWAVRKAGLGLLMGKKGRKKAIAVIEDSAIPVKKLAKFYSEVKSMMDELRVTCVYYGHASVGLIHIRPELDMAIESDRALFRTIASQHSALVKKYRGSLSGEHGDGRLRAPYIKEQVGENVYGYLKQLKNIFDPKRLLNPDVIISEQDNTQNLRAFRQPIKTLKTGFNWQSELSLMDAVEKCNGAGVCRKSSGYGTMCPSYQATKHENNSTRGRSNLLRHALTEADPLNALNADDLQQAFELCLACKACKSECPASVDMAKLKSELLYQTNSPFNLSHLLLKHYGLILNWAQKASDIFNALQKLNGVKHALGIDKRRALPTVVSSSNSLKKYCETLPALKIMEHNKPTIWIVCDLFSQYFEPEIGKAVINSLIPSGLNIRPIFISSSPRALISQGLLKDAKKALLEINHQLNQVRKNDLVVGIEPSEVLVWRDEALMLIGHTQPVLLYEELMVTLSQRDYLPPFKSLNKTVELHLHCHQKSLAKSEQSIQALELIPDIKVTLLNTGCCGMSGDFGYKHFDISKTIAQTQFIPKINTNNDVLTVATGTSCRHQLTDFSNKKGLHSAQVFEMAL